MCPTSSKNYLLIGEQSNRCGKEHPGSPLLSCENPNEEWGEGYSY